MYIRLVYTVIIGIISGLLGGAFGLGGSFIMLPGLILMNIVPNFQTAVGTVLFSLLPPVSLLAVYEYSKKKQIDYVVATLLFIAYFIAAYYGEKFAEKYSEKALKYGCAISFLVITIYFFYDAYMTKATKDGFRGFI
jgi:uncharacterized protein